MSQNNWSVLTQKDREPRTPNANDSFTYGNSTSVSSARTPEAARSQNDTTFDHQHHSNHSSFFRPDGMAQGTNLSMLERRNY